MTDQHETPGEPSRAAGSNRPLVIAIDGPSGSGKSSTARGVAERLGLAFLDTGAMYRAITWLALQEGVDLGPMRRRGSVCHASWHDQDPQNLDCDNGSCHRAIKRPNIGAVSAVSPI